MGAGMGEAIAGFRRPAYTQDMSDLRIDLNIALLPDPDLARQLVAASHKFADHYPAIVRLGDADHRLSMAPHLTLYQVPVPVPGLPALHDGLRALARAGRALELACTALAYNEGEASLEARTDSPGELVRLQCAVLDLANPIRGGLLMDRDPAGNRLAGLLEHAGNLGVNINAAGYAEIGELFRPHDTLNWFEPGTRIDEGALESLVNLATLSGAYTALGLFALGPYGTCPQLLARYEFES
jgi:hypothetical protein